MPVPVTVTAIVLPGPTAVGTAEASTASTLGVELVVLDEELVPLDVAGELVPAGAFVVVLLLLLLPPPGNANALNLSPIPSSELVRKMMMGLGFSGWS